MTSVLLADLADSDHQRAIVDLLDMYCRDEFGDSRPLDDEVRRTLIPRLVEHGGARVFLAYAREEPAGLALCFVGFSSFKARPLLNIHDIAVRPEYREQGVGRELLAAAIAHARAAGYCKVTLEVRSDNARAMRAYRAAGFQSTQPETWFWSRPLEP
jgi:ribosomal protein S18 acetylase RimI-like enzyme